MISLGTVLGEFMGTMILVLLGDGVVANVCLKRSKAEGGGWMVGASGWAMGVMGGIFTAMLSGSSDAHLNPAVTLGAAIQTGDFSKILWYWPAQVAGAMAGAVLVWLHFLPHWRETPDPAVKLSCFCTIPAIRRRWFNLLSEIIASFVLVLVVAAIFSRAATGGAPAPGLAPYLVAALVWGIGLSLGGVTGYAINPARDFGPRLAHAILPIAGKGSSDWGYAPVPILGPLIGATLAGVLVRALM